MAKSRVKANGWRRHATGIRAGCYYRNYPGNGGDPDCNCLQFEWGKLLAESAAASHRARVVR